VTRRIHVGCRSAGAHADGGSEHADGGSEHALAGTHVHVRFSHDAHVATDAECLERTCTCVSVRESVRASALKGRRS
jgi:hypothetical protein